MDFYLQPMVKNMPLHLKGTKDVIRLIQGIAINLGVLLATADVASLYTCISQQLGFEAVDRGVNPT